MINTLHISNFMRHEELEVSFSPDETLIVGANWAGKTTVFKGILYALFGPAAIPGGAKVIQRRGTKAKPAVTLTFSIGTDQYTVIRKQTVARLLKGESLQATGPANVTAAVEDLLGMPAKLFGELRTSPQDEVSAILTLGIGRLNQIIGQITKADMIEKILGILKARTQKADAELGVLPAYDLNALSASVAAAVQKLNADHATLEQANAEVVSSSEKMTAAQSTVDLFNQQVADYYAAVKQREDLERSIQSITDRLAEAEQEILEADVPDIPALQAAYQDLAAAAQQAQDAASQKAAYTNMLHQLQLDKQREEDVKNELLRAKSKEGPGVTSQDVEDQTTKVQKLRQQYGEVGERARAAQSAADNSVCPTCNRVFDGQDQAALVEAAEVAAREYMLVNVELDKEEGVLTRTTEIRTAQQKLSNQLAASSEALEELDARVRAAEATIQGLGKDEQQLPELEVAEQEAAVALNLGKLAQSQYTQADAKKTRLTPELEQAQVALGGLEAGTCPSRHDLGVANQELQVAQSEQQNAAVSAASLAAHYAAAYQEYVRLDAELNAAKADAQRREEKQGQVKDLNTLTTYLTRSHKDFIDRTWANILEHTSDFVSRCTGDAISEIHIQDGSKFSYTEDGEQMPLASASGFQRACIGVGIRLALAEAVRSPAGVMLLDEVTAGASEENSMAMAQALSQIGQQVVMVTHRQADSAVADKVIQL